MFIHNKVAFKNHITAYIDPFLLRHLSADQKLCQGPYSNIPLSIGIFLDHVVKYGTPEPVRGHIRKVRAYGKQSSRPPAFFQGLSQHNRTLRIYTAAGSYIRTGDLIINIYKTLFFFDLSIVIAYYLPSVKAKNAAVSNLWREGVFFTVMLIFTLLFKTAVEHNRLKIFNTANKFRHYSIGLFPFHYVP